MHRHDHIPQQQQKCLELPPRLTKIESKTLSPTTVLDGPSDLKGKTSTLLSSSFRFSKESRRRLEGRHNKSFDSCDGWSTPVEDNSGQHVMLLGGGSAKGIFGSFRFNNNSNKHNKVKGSSVISPLSTMDNSFFEEKKGKRLRRNSSLSKVTRSHFWATLYEGIKHVVPWRKRSKNERYSL
ncbi:hypothetical protein CTI12_AA512510 [Artemisia annua]|uniref:Uncharacterized protein n=1 Tax=Artemisia annua TaxID=35608 RepID=A0A2U1L9X9_ARTAN|nr:hypothetical protein CTI12_AA512510 [Artemisia annua]